MCLVKNAYFHSDMKAPCTGCLTWSKLGWKITPSLRATPVKPVWIPDIARKCSTGPLPACGTTRHCGWMKFWDEGNMIINAAHWRYSTFSWITAGRPLLQGLCLTAHLHISPLGRHGYLTTFPDISPSPNFDGTFRHARGDPIDGHMSNSTS